jgi:hypothetical protein
MSWSTNTVREVVDHAILDGEDIKILVLTPLEAVLVIGNGCCLTFCLVVSVSGLVCCRSSGG